MSNDNDESNKISTSDNPTVPTNGEIVLPKLSNQKLKTCKLISKDTDLKYYWPLSTDNNHSFRLASSNAGGCCNSRRFDMDALLNRLEEFKRSFKTADMARIINIGCNNTPGFVIAVLVNEGFVEQLPSQKLGKRDCPRWFRLVNLPNQIV